MEWGGYMLASNQRATGTKLLSANAEDSPCLLRSFLPMFPSVFVLRVDSRLLSESPTSQLFFLSFFVSWVGGWWGAGVVGLCIGKSVVVLTSAQYIWIGRGEVENPAGDCTVRILMGVVQNENPSV